MFFVRNSLFSIFVATLHIGGRSSIHNLRTRHVVVTGIHLLPPHKLHDVKIIVMYNGVHIIAKRMEINL